MLLLRASLRRCLSTQPTDLTKFLSTTLSSPPPPRPSHFSKPTKTFPPSSFRPSPRKQALIDRNKEIIALCTTGPGATSPLPLLDFFDEHGHDYNNVNWSTTFRYLGKHDPAKLRTLIFDNPNTWARFIHMVDSMMGYLHHKTGGAGLAKQIGPRNLAQLAFSLSRLDAANSQRGPLHLQTLELCAMLDFYAEYLCETNEEQPHLSSNPETAAMIASAFAHANYASSFFFSTLNEPERSEWFASSINLNQAVATLWAFAKLKQNASTFVAGTFPPESHAALLDSPPSLLSKYLWSLSKMSISSPLFKNLATAPSLPAVIAAANARDVSQIAWSYGLRENNAFSCEVFKAIANDAPRIIATGSAHTTSTILQAFEKSRSDPALFVQALGSSTLKLSHGRWYATIVETLSYFPPTPGGGEFLTKLGELSLNIFRGTSAKDLGKLCRALSRLSGRGIDCELVIDGILTYSTVNELTNTGSTDELAQVLNCLLLYDKVGIINDGSLLDGVNAAQLLWEAAVQNILAGHDSPSPARRKECVQILRRVVCAFEERGDTIRIPWDSSQDYSEQLAIDLWEEIMQTGEAGRGGGGGGARPETTTDAWRAAARRMKKAPVVEVKAEVAEKKVEVVAVAEEAKVPLWRKLAEGIQAQLCEGLQEDRVDSVYSADTPRITANGIVVRNLAFESDEASIRALVGGVCDRGIESVTMFNTQGAKGRKRREGVKVPPGFAFVGFRGSIVVDELLGLSGTVVDGKEISVEISQKKAKEKKNRFFHDSNPNGERKK